MPEKAGLRLTGKRQPSGEVLHVTLQNKYVRAINARHVLSASQHRQGTPSFKVRAGPALSPRGRASSTVPVGHHATGSGHAHPPPSTYRRIQEALHP